MFTGGVWLVDFEFHPYNAKEGNLPIPVCMVAREFATGLTIKMWQDELLRSPCPPFPTDASALFVAFYASAEFNCFLQLGWEMPKNVLDLYSEFRCLTNGKQVPSGNGLIGALVYFGQDSLEATEKEEMRNLVLRGAPWTPIETGKILDYCATDVDALAKLLPQMQSKIDLPRALVRGQYSIAAAHIETSGVPIDTVTYKQLQENWLGISQQLIDAIDGEFHVYEGGVFKLGRWERYLQANNISWPRLGTGTLDMKDETFKQMCSAHPQLQSMRELRGALAQMRLNELPVGDDGRNRCMLSMFRSKTGRNQPSNSKSIFGPSVWMRGLIQPQEGYGLAYVDWSQQEFGIAAALAQDQNMMEAYQSGDPYLAFAKQAGAVPSGATKQTHKIEREQFKACVLAVQYGMGAESLAFRINQPVARARELLGLHKHAYKRFWQWSEGVLNEAVLGRRLWTTFGWQLFVDGKLNGRSLCNFPMQANGSEMLRLACTQLVQDGVSICAPVHDALLIEAPLHVLGEVVAHTQKVMREISMVVLGGFALESDAKVVRYPERYMDDRGVKMWNTVMNLIGVPEKYIAPK